MQTLSSKNLQQVTYGSTYYGLFIQLSVTNCYLEMCKVKYKSECLLTVLCAHKTGYFIGEKKETECLGMGS